MATPPDGPGENDAAKRTEPGVEQAATRTEGSAATDAARSARERESDAHSEQAHHWRPSRLPRSS